MSDIVSSDRNEVPLIESAEGETTLVIPIIKERLDVHKRLVTTGLVRIEKLVREHEAVISEPFTAENIQVERVPMNLIVEVAPAVRTEGEVTVIPVLEEIIVTTKQLRLVEEVRITRCRSTRVYEENVTLRSEEVMIDRQSPLSS